MSVVLLAGGVGGAKFALGLRAALNLIADDVDLTIIVNIGDDMWLSGLKVCPDLDSMMYALAGVNDQDRGWGRAGESARVSGELTAYRVGWPWFTLQDLDLGTHIARTGLLRSGKSLTAATAHLAARWQLGARLLPASDQDVETWVDVLDDKGGAVSLHFEEWWVRLRAASPATRFAQRGIESASATPDVIEAIMGADVVLFAPSNPVVSLGTMFGFPGAGGRPGVPGIPGITQAIRATPAPVVGVSPLIENAPLRGMAAQCLEAVGQPCTAAAVGVAYGSRAWPEGLLDGWLVDTADADAVPVLQQAGIAARAVPLWMHDQPTSTALAQAALAMAESTRPGSSSRASYPGDLGYSGSS